MECQISYRNSFSTSILVKQIHTTKSKILSYEDHLKLQYQNKLAILNKYILHLQSDKQKSFQLIDKREQFKIIHEQIFTYPSPLLKQEQKACQFLQKEVLHLQKLIHQIGTKISTKRQHTSTLKLQALQLKQILVQQKRKYADFCLKHQQLLLTIQKKKQALTKQNSDESKFYLNHQSQVSNSQFKTETDLGKKRSKSLKYGRKSLQVIHECHAELKKNWQAKDQLKKKENLMQKQKQSDKKGKNNESLAVRRKSLSSVNLFSKVVNQQRQEQRKAKYNFASLSFMKRPVQMKIQSGQSDSSQGFDKLMVSFQTVQKLEQVQEMRRMFHKMNTDEIMRLIMKQRIWNEVGAIIESQKLSTVKKYQQFKKACLIPHKQNKLKL